MILDTNKLEQVLLETGRKLLEDPDKIKTVCGRAKPKLDEFEKEGKSDDAVSSAVIILSILKSYFSGDYKNISKSSLAIMLGTLAYVVSPLDLLPDPIPGIGLSDDIAVLVFAVGVLAADIITYKNWLAAKNDPQSDLNEYLNETVGSDKVERDKETDRLLKEHDTVTASAAVAKELEKDKVVEDSQN